MIYVDLVDGSTVSLNRNGHVPYINVDEVKSVSCSDQHLDKALALTGLPRVPERSTMSFYGDFAKHIIGNWDEPYGG